MTYYSSQLEVSHILAIWLGVLLEPIVDVSNCHCPASWIFIWRAISSRKTVKALTSLLRQFLTICIYNLCNPLFLWPSRDTFKCLSSLQLLKSLLYMPMFLICCYLCTLPRILIHYLTYFTPNISFYILCGTTFFLLVWISLLQYLNYTSPLLSFHLILHRT